MKTTKGSHGSRRTMAVRGIWALGALLAAATAACDTDPTVPEGTAVFVLSVNGEEFRAAVTDPDAIDALEARMAADAEGVVSGTLAPGDGGFNEPWSWHWDPTTVHVPDVAMEVCDGWPGFVEEELEYWLGTVKQFCPWGARVVRREQ